MIKLKNLCLDSDPTEKQVKQSKKPEQPIVEKSESLYSVKEKTGKFTIFYI